MYIRLSPGPRTLLPLICLLSAAATTSCSDPASEPPLGDSSGVGLQNMNGGMPVGGADSQIGDANPMPTTSQTATSDVPQAPTTPMPMPSTAPTSTGGGTVPSGSTPASSATGTPPPIDPPASVLFSEDFEGDTMLDPAAWQPSIQGGNEQGISIDSTQGHDSSSSLHISHTGFHTMASLISPDVIPLPNGAGYVRVWMKIGGAIPSGHATFIEAGSTMNDDKEVRIGVNLDVIDVNYWPGDWEQRTESLNWTPDEWHCVEFFLDSTNHEMRVWYDDAEQTSLHVTDWTGMPGNHPTPESNWMPSIDSIRFGGELQAAEIWFDDIAVSSEPIGCQ